MRRGSFRRTYSVRRSGIERIALSAARARGRAGARITGIILTVTGISLAGAGVPMLVFGALSDSSASETFTTAGALSTGAGAILLVTGIALWASNKTSIRVDSALIEPKLRLPAGLALSSRGIVF